MQAGNKATVRGSKGGKARAKALSSKQRQDIARKGAEAKWAKDKASMSQSGTVGLPEAAHTGTLTIGDLLLPCAVLEDRSRVITESSVAKHLGRGYGGKSKRLAQSSKHPLPSFLYGAALEPFVSPSLRIALSNPILYKARGRVRRAVNATLLPEICEVWLKARDHGTLQPSQEHIARNADVLMRGLAHVGIIALVDEATGYQEFRDRDELHRILEAYISRELLPWTKRFPDEFYEQLFRLRGWQYRPPSVKRPKYVGKLTNELVYEQLPEGVLDELRSRNPVIPKGWRRHKHFQFLTDDIGNPHLEKQVAAVTTLMRASPNWATFDRLFKRAFGQQGEFYFEELEK